MRRHGTALGYPSILVPIVLAMFSARVVKAQCAETRAAQTNRSANDITATNAASSGASMISSIGCPNGSRAMLHADKKVQPNQKVPVKQYFAIKVQRFHSSLTERTLARGIEVETDTSVETEMSSDPKTNEWNLLKHQFEALVHDESVGADSIEEILDVQFRRRFAELIKRVTNRGRRHGVDAA